MTTLNVVLTHLPAATAQRGLCYLRDIAPSARFVVCHGGQREDFDALEYADKVFVDDSTLRGPPITLQSYHAILGAVHWRFVRNDPDIDAIYVFEYDHVILNRDFESLLRQLAVETGADFMGKTCLDRTATNWPHYARFRRDDRLLSHLRVLSVRQDPTRLYGCLGDGFWMSRAPLEAYLKVEDHPPCYGELYLPTLLHHLGFKLIDIDSHSPLYRYVRWHPPFTLDDVLRLRGKNPTFVHPFKQSDALDALRPVAET